MSSILQLARPDLLGFKAYSHAEWAPSLERLHANELPWRCPGDNSRAGLNRYPEPQPQQLRARLAELYGVEPTQLLLGRGSDEAIDLLVRAFCRAEHDRVLICPPTFGMYRVAAALQGAAVVEVPLRRESAFALDATGVLQGWAPGTKIVFLCSPNNPTGNTLPTAAIERLCLELEGRALIVLDEAYVEFSGEPSRAALLPRFQNLVVLRTLSKAYGLAGARCGALLAHAEIVGLLQRVIAPYAIPALTLEAALHALEPPQLAIARARVATVLAERERLASALSQLPLIERVWPSRANFLLIDCSDAERAFQAAVSAGLLVRDLRQQPGFAQSLRVTVGTPEQNARLLRALGQA